MERGENQSTAEALTTLSRLHREGSLSDDEFHSLKQKIVTSAESSHLLGNAVGKAPNTAGSTFGLIIAGLIGLIVVDHVSGPILPDELYCVMGAGSSFIEPGRTEANSWSANNGCGAYRPECATSWAYHPPANRCVHGTLWEGIQAKLKQP
jgi:hypothetical protein